MDLYNQNGNNKRKFSQSVERDEQSKKKTNQSIGCFRRCCTRKKQHQVTLNVPITRWTRSPMYNETAFCRKRSESYDDPCLECCVQYGPDIWENIYRKNRLYDNQETVSNKRSDRLWNENVKEDDLGHLFTKEKSTHHREKELKTNSSDSIRSKQNLEPVLKKTSQMSDYLSTDHLPSKPSSQTTPDGYNWNLLSNEIKFDQQKVSDGISQNQEPYNWDSQEPSLTILNQQQSISNLIEGKTDQLDTTSADHLFIHATKQKSFGSDTTSADHSTSVSDRPFQSSALPNTVQTTFINENQPFSKIRSTYDDMMNFWGNLLERFFHFMSPFTENTDHNPDSSYSWSTMIPSPTLDMTQSDSIGPWWGRRDVYDQSPATFIFANESLSISHSIESITSNQQMCISIDNMPCYFNCSSYSDTCHCCCSSSPS